MKIVIVNQKKEETVSSTLQIYLTVCLIPVLLSMLVGSVFFNLTYAFDRSQNSCNPRKANLTKGTKNE